jgi:hypothetical protein
MIMLCLLCWGPSPIGCLWLGSRANYWSGSTNVGIVVSSGMPTAALFGALSVL